MDASFYMSHGMIEHGLSLKMYGGVALYLSIR